jgi:hypothetical protein
MGSRSRSRYVLSLLALFAAPFASSCEEGSSITDNPSALCSGYDPAGNKRPEFGAEAAGRKLNAIMDASLSLVKAAAEIDADTLSACRSMAKELAIAEADLVVPDTMKKRGGDETKLVCGKVKAELDRLIASLDPKVRIKVVATPAVCTLDAEFTHKCVETCEMKTITQKELHCQGGRLAGSCSAMCTGSCSGTCSAGCKGSCSASCQGKCTAKIAGKCDGTCKGTCDGKPSGGQCAGKCEGECTADVNGQCEGSCEGSCSGTCSGECNAMCTGTCSGGCSVDFQAPRCETVAVQKEVTECEQHCDTRARAEAKCTEPELSVTVDTNLEAEKVKAAKLVAAFKVGLPKIYKAGTKGKGLIEVTAKAYSDALRGLPTALLQTGLQASGCVAAAGQATASAVAQIGVSVEFSVSVQASASARAGTN